MSTGIGHEDEKEKESYERLKTKFEKERRGPPLSRPKRDRANWHA